MRPCCAPPGSGATGRSWTVEVVDGDGGSGRPATARRPVLPGVIEGRIVEGPVVEGQVVEGPVIDGTVVDGEIVDGPDTGGRPR